MESLSVYNHLRGSNEDSNIFINFIQVVHKSIDLEEVYDVALDSVTKLENVDMSMIYLVDEEKNEAVLKAYRNVPEDYVRRANRIPYPKGITWKIINTGKMLNVEDAQKDPDIGPAGRDLGHHSILGVPIFLEEKVIGVIWFLSYKENKFTEKDVDLLTTIGDQIAIAISKAKQTKELEEQNRHLSILSTISQEVHQSIDLNQVYTTVLNATKNLKFIDIVSVYLVEGEGDNREAVLQAHRGYTEEYLARARRIPYAKGVTWQVITSREPVYYENASDPSTPLGAAGRILGARALLSIPVQSGNETIGVVHFSSCEKTSFTQQERDFLLALGSQIGTAIAKAKMIEEIKKREETLSQNLVQLAKKNRYQTIISTITRSVHQSINLQDVLENAVETMSQNIETVKHVAIYLVEGEAVLKAYRGYPDWFIERVRRIPYPKGFTWKAILGGKPIHCPDVDKDTLIGPAGREVGTKSYVSMPIRTEGKVVGCININALEKNAFDDDDLALLEIIAQQIGAAIDNAQKVEALRESEKRFALFMKNLPGVAFMKDVQGRYIYVNEALTNVLHKGPREWLGNTDDDLWPPAVAGQFKENDRIVIEGKKALQAIETFPHKDGPRYWLTSKFPIYDKNEDSIVVGGVAVDITEHKRAEERIREQAALLDIATDAITVQDMEHRILFWSKGAERIYGWRAEEVVGKKATEFLFKEDRRAFEEAFRIVKEKGEWHGELRQINKDGGEMIIECRWTLVTDDEGEPKSIFVVGADITEKKKIEAQFLRTQRLESIGTLAGGIAHDLNNVLQPIMMALEILRLRFKDDKSQNLIDTLEKSAMRGSNLVKQVLSFARGLEGERTVLQVRHIIFEIQQILKETFPKSIDVNTDIPKDLWAISGDSTQLHQVLMNLCVNARDAMPNGGRLTITAENLFIDESYAQMNIEAKVGPYILITVSDTGAGISPEIIDKIFEPFFTTKEPGKGTGLGLSTAFGIVKDHGGFINVYSEVGKGTRFRIYLPANQTSETQEAGEKQVEELPLGHGELILVVDDETSICDITKSTLETSGYKVVTANDGSEALALYAQRRDEIRVVLVDMVMPIMDGLATIRALRRIDPRVKIIAVSGLKDTNKIDVLNVADVNIFLQKPYTAKTLLKTVHEVISTK